MKKPTNILKLSLYSLLFLSIASIDSQAAYKKLKIQSITQLYQNDCWAACGMMVLGWYEITETYEDFWHLGNGGGTNDVPISISALSGLINQYPKTTSYTSSTLTWQNCLDDIGATNVVVNRPIIAGIRLSGSSSNIGHALLLYGYENVLNGCYWIDPAFGANNGTLNDFMTDGGGGSFMGCIRMSTNGPNCAVIGKKRWNPVGLDESEE